MTNSWTVIINKLPYGVKAAQPWTAVSKALRQWRETHLDSSMILFEISLINLTLAEKADDKAGDKNAKERS
jgi:hypothetical protein